MATYIGNRFEFVKTDLVKIIDPAYSTYYPVGDIVEFTRIVPNNTWSYPTFVSASSDYTPQSASLGGGNRWVNGVIQIDPRTGPGVPVAGSEHIFNNPITTKHYQTYTDGAFQTWMGNPASDNGLTICGIIQIVHARTGALDWVDFGAPSGGEAFQRENMINTNPFNPLTGSVPGSYFVSGYNFGISPISGFGTPFTRLGEIRLGVIPQDSQPGKLRVDLFTQGTIERCIVRTSTAILRYGTTESNAPWMFFCFRWKLPKLHKFSTGGEPSQLPSVLTTAFNEAFFHVDDQVAAFDVISMSPSHFDWSFSTTGGYNIGANQPGVAGDGSVTNNRWEFGWFKQIEPSVRRSMNVAHLMIYDRLLTSTEVAINRAAYKRRFPNLGLL